MAKTPAKPPLLEWIAAALGLLLLLGVGGVIARDSFAAGDETAPELAISVTRVRSTATGFLLEFEARNLSPVTAAQVTVEGESPNGETSSATIDYVPGRSARRGGLLFAEDPRGARLRALGYQNP